MHKSQSAHMMPSTLADVRVDPTAFVTSQAHLLATTKQNPYPTMTPPPIAGLASHHLTKRQVAIFLGLPLRGKGYMALRLEHYLRFFHGAIIKVFDVSKYVDEGHLLEGGARTPTCPSSDARLLKDLEDFFEEAEEPHRCYDSLGHVCEEHVDSLGHHRRKHVDSGGFAIIYPSSTVSALPSMWSASSKWPRRWIKNTLESQVQAGVFFIEAHCNDSTKHRHEYVEHVEEERGLSRGTLQKEIDEYALRYCTIQDDGSEDDLSYMKLLNFNRKHIVCNMTRNYIGCKVAQFLAATHPYRRTIYLTRHGESKYNEEQKIGGDSSLSELGAEYARRLGEFADFVVCKGARRFVCVSCRAADVERLAPRLEEVTIGDATVIRTAGRWDCFDDLLLQQVQAGLHVVRVQRAPDGPFEPAPGTVGELLADVRAGVVTMVLAEESAAGEPPELARLWTSSMKRTNETAAHIPHPVVTMPSGGEWVQMAKRVYRNLDEIYAGEFEGLTYAEVKEREPKEASLRLKDKLGYRYPRGESYYDLISRLETPMLQLETISEPVLVVAHQAILRLVYAWLKGLPREEVLDLNIPLHTVIRIEIDAGSRAEHLWTERRYFLGPTQRNKDDGQKNL